MGGRGASAGFGSSNGGTTNGTPIGGGGFGALSAAFGGQTRGVNKPGYSSLEGVYQPGYTNNDNENDVRAIARDIVKRSKTSAELEDIVSGIREMGNYLVQHTGADLSYDELYSMAEDIASEIYSNVYELLKQMKDQIRRDLLRQCQVKERRCKNEETLRPGCR